MVMTVVFMTLETIDRLLQERIMKQRSWGMEISLKFYLDIGHWFPKNSTKLNSDLIRFDCLAEN